MRKPNFLSETDATWELSRVFNTPLVVRRDISAFPLTEFATTAVLYRRIDREFETLGSQQKWAWSVGCMLALLGSEWCHNLAHTFVASRIGRPVDVIRVNLGMPLLIYFDTDDPRVTPGEHILRAAGGPVFNLLTLLPLALAKSRVNQETPIHFLMQLAFDTNLFLSTASLAPLPPLDGGPLLKWSLVHSGKPVDEAERIVKKANSASAILFSILAIFSYFRDKKLIAALLGLLGLSSLAIASGWLEEAY
ncbi:MAG: hypothetical protein PVI04_10700 [Anaerolineales bacterium]|jgi:hypothetical protein